MAQVKGMKITVKKSGSPDVETYALYMQKSPQPVDYQSERFDLTGLYVEEGDNIVFDMTDISDMTTKDGTYNIGIVAIDDAGNESSMSVANNIQFDFIAPDPPGAIIVERL